MKKINNFVKKDMDSKHRPATHVDKKKRESVKKCRAGKHGKFWQRVLKALPRTREDKYS